MKKERVDTDEVEERAELPAARSSEKGNVRLEPLVELTLARLREFVREPEAIFWVLIFPLLLTFALGIAFRNTGPEKIRVAIESDQHNAGAQMSRLAEALARSGEIEAVSLSKDDAARALRSGKVALVVRPVEAGAETEKASDATEQATLARTPFNYRYDPSRPESHTARLLVDDVLQRALGRRDVTSAGEERVSEPGARYIDFLIPGLLGLNIMGSGLMGVGFAIVTARMRKLLKLLAATPMRRSHYLLSFVFARLIFLLLEVGAVIIFARLVFSYTVHGSLPAMVSLLITGAFAFSGIGLLLASRAATIEGASGLLNMVMMPMWLLSGTFFSSERFPAFLQPFIKVLPLTALNDALRAVMNEGATLADNLMPLCVLLAWAVLSFIIALKVFRWQ
ncbi:MAG TPA: ABC transporter permease [Pyrinomonadaceae bacterium]|jgi:ABC-type multidrug transport system permease subunit